MSRVLKWLLVVLLAIVGLGAGLFALTFRNELQKLETKRSEWQARQARSEAQLLGRLESARAGDEGWGTPVPASLGCRVGWESAAPRALERHLRRCGPVQGPAPEVREAARKLGDDGLSKVKTLAGLPTDLGWMRELRGARDWRSLEGTPWDRETFDETVVPMEAPVVRCDDAQVLALARLAEGLDQRSLNEAVEDVVALADALGGLPVGGGLCRWRVLDRTRALLSNAQQPPPGVLLEETHVAAGRMAELAAMWLWDPWSTRTHRDAVAGRLSERNRCVAAVEGANLVLQFGPQVSARYPTLRAEFEAWRNGLSCGSRIDELIAWVSKADPDRAFAAARRFLRNGLLDDFPVLEAARELAFEAWLNEFRPQSDPEN